jgi:inhibitor of cysteine peptidase
MPFREWNGRSLEGGEMGGSLAGWSIGLTCLACLATAGLGACGGGGAEIGVGQSDSGSTVSAAVGDVIVVRLAENPTTGFTWKMKLSKGLDLESDKFIADDAPEDMVGVGGTHQWRIKVVETGKQKIEGEYRQEWSPDDNAQFFTLTVDAE